MTLGLRHFFSLVSVLVTAATLSATVAAQSDAHETNAVRRERQNGTGLGVRKYEIVDGGVTRNYLLFVPPTHANANPAPLLLVFHGGGGHAYDMPRFTGFDDLAESRGFVVAYPDSANTHWNDSRQLSLADDVGFVGKVIREIEDNFPIDRTRIYATGFSNGGFFVQRVACDLSSQVAAVASVAATMPEALVPRCHPAKPVSVMFIQGTADPLVDIDGGEVARTHGRNISLGKAAGFWLVRDRIDSKPESADLPNHDSNGTSVYREVYAGGQEDTEVVVYTIRGGGHTWPGGPRYSPSFLVGKVNHDLNASEAIWDFFSRHKRQ